MPLELCVLHIEQYYRDWLKANPFLLEWQLRKGVLVKVDDITLPCQWCRAGMPTF
jgi:hypothetical protein